MTFERYCGFCHAKRSSYAPGRAGGLSRNMPSVHRGSPRPARKRAGYLYEARLRGLNHLTGHCHLRPPRTRPAAPHPAAPQPGQHLRHRREAVALDYAGARRHAKRALNRRAQRVQLHSDAAPDPRARCRRCRSSDWRRSRAVGGRRDQHAAPQAIASSSVSGGSTATGARERQQHHVGGRVHERLALLAEVLEARPASAARCRRPRGDVLARPGAGCSRACRRARTPRGQQGGNARAARVSAPRPSRRGEAERRDRADVRDQEASSGQAERRARAPARSRRWKARASIGGGTTTAACAAEWPRCASASRTASEAARSRRSRGRRARPSERAPARRAPRYDVLGQRHMRRPRGRRARRSTGASASGSPTRWATSDRLAPGTPRTRAQDGRRPR